MTPAAPPISVLGAVAVRQPAAAAPQAAAARPLAFTGANSTVPLFLGLVALLSGTALLALSRARWPFNRAARRAMNR